MTEKLNKPTIGSKCELFGNSSKQKKKIYWRWQDICHIDILRNILRTENDYHQGGRFHALL